MPYIQLKTPFVPIHAQAGYCNVHMQLFMSTPTSEVTLYQVLIAGRAPVGVCTWIGRGWEQKTAWPDTVDMQHIKSYSAAVLTPIIHMHTMNL